MAVVSYTVSDPGKFDSTLSVITWTALANGDTGQPLEMSGWADRSVQVTAATVTIEGSNDGTTYFTLTDASNAATSGLGATLKQITEITKFIRPSVTAGGPSTIIMVIKRRI